MKVLVDTMVITDANADDLQCALFWVTDLCVKAGPLDLVIYFSGTLHGGSEADDYVNYVEHLLNVHHFSHKDTLHCFRLPELQFEKKSRASDDAESMKTVCGRQKVERPCDPGNVRVVWYTQMFDNMEIVIRNGRVLINAPCPNQLILEVTSLGDLSASVEVGVGFNTSYKTAPDGGAKKDRYFTHNEQMDRFEKLRKRFFGQIYFFNGCFASGTPNLNLGKVGKDAAIAAEQVAAGSMAVWGAFQQRSHSFPEKPIGQSSEDVAQ